MTYIASKCKKIDLGCERLTHLDIAVGHLCCVRGGIRIFGFAVLAIFLDRFFDFFVPKKLQFLGFGVHCSLRVFRFPQGGRQGRVRLHVGYC